MSHERKNKAMPSKAAWRVLDFIAENSEGMERRVMTPKCHILDILFIKHKWKIVVGECKGILSAAQRTACTGRQLDTSFCWDGSYGAINSDIRRR